MRSAACRAGSRRRRRAEPHGRADAVPLLATPADRLPAAGRRPRAGRGAAAGRGRRRRSCRRRRSSPPPPASRCVPPVDAAVLPLGETADGRRSWRGRRVTGGRRSAVADRRRCPGRAVPPPVERSVRRRRGAAVGPRAAGAVAAADPRGRRRSPPRTGPGWARSAGSTLTMMSPNCSGSVSRPRVSIGSWKACPGGAGRLADLPGGAPRGSGCGSRWPRRWRSCCAPPASAGRARRGCCSRAGP